MSGYDSNEKKPGLLIRTVDGRLYLRREHTRDASSFYTGNHFPGVIGPLDDPNEEANDWCLNASDHAILVREVDHEEVQEILKRNNWESS